MPDARKRRRTLMGPLCWGSLPLVAVALLFAWPAQLLTGLDGAAPARERAQENAYPPMGEVATDGEPVRAIGTPSFGTLGVILQLIVVLACPAMFVALWLMQRYEGRAAEGLALERTTAEEPRI